MTSRTEDVIPPWALALFAECQRAKFTGFLQINWRAGEIKHVEEKRMHFPPSSGVPQCPRGCGPMESREHGTLWLCGACGSKRTLAQLKFEGRQ